MKYVCDSCGGPTDDARTIEGIPRVFHTCKACAEKFDREFDYQNAGETFRERSIICPHCRHEYDDYDAYGFEEGATEGVVCEFCGEKFDLEAEHLYRYSTKRSLSEMPADYGIDTEEDNDE